MNRLLLPTVTAVVLAACARHPVHLPVISETRQGQESPAIAIEQEVRRLAANSGTSRTLWPGFEPLAIPLAVYDGERTFLFRHPAPPRGFSLVSGAGSAAHAYEGRHEAVTANTNADVGGVPTATILVDRPQPDRSLTEIAAVAIHEAFHVYQRARHPGWIGNEADLFTYPTDSASLLALRRLETDALRQALAADDRDRAACWARAALVLRRQRYATMDSAFAAYERGTELNEGLASYVERRAAGRRSVELPTREFGPAEVRRRAYATGSALALLLDRFRPEWPATFESNDTQRLDLALAEAVGPGPACESGDAAVAEASRHAQADIASLKLQRAQKLVAFEGKRGWRVVVESGASEPLWPQGFDPLNVDRIEAGRVLHSRFLRLGNGAGKLEVLNAEALTDAVGPHPLFQGVRRVAVAGLGEPEISEADGRVQVRAPGLTLEFRGASVARSGEVITVRVGQDRAGDRAADRREIEAILARWENAWNAHDMKAFGTMFHEDGTWILWTGAVWVGRQIIEDGHAAVHKTVFRNSIQRERLEELTFVGPDAAVVRFCSTLIGDERTPTVLVRSRKFLVVTRREGLWKVNWGQNTRLADSAPDSECFAELRKSARDSQPLHQARRSRSPSARR